MASKKILCPYCFEEFDNTEALYQCESDERNMDGSLRCNRVTSDEYNLYWKENSPIRFVWPQKSGFMSKLFGPKLHSEKCPQCGYMSQRFVCPHCYNWIPEDMVKNGAQIISVIGSPSSGKTNYIIALIHQLMGCGFLMDLQVHPTQIYRDGYKEESTQNRFINFERQLFKDKQVLNKTVVSDKDIPWIFHLIQQHTNQHIYLVFYDSAGEKFNDGLKNNVKYLKESSAVIVLLDTLSIEYVGDVLREEGMEGLGGKTEAHITAIAESLTDYGQGIIKSKPMEFVLSKFDAVLDHSDKLQLNTDAFKKGNKRINSSYLNTGVVDLDQINAISCSIEQALAGPWRSDENKSGNLLSFARGWGSKKNQSLPFAQQDPNDPDNNYKFFGVSALGGMPDEALQLKKVEPYRVLDPLMWVLHKLGQFDIPTKK